MFDDQGIRILCESIRNFYTFLIPLLFLTFPCAAAPHNTFVIHSIRPFLRSYSVFHETQFSMSESPLNDHRYLHYFFRFGILTGTLLKDFNINFLRSADLRNRSAKAWSGREMLFFDPESSEITGRISNRGSETHGGERQIDLSPIF